MKSKKIHQNILKDKIIKVYVKQDEHANLDSLPLRFGYYYRENKVLEIYNCREQSIENDEDKTGTKYRCGH